MPAVGIGICIFAARGLFLPVNSSSDPRTLAIAAALIGCAGALTAMPLAAAAAIPSTVGRARALRRR